MSKRKAEILEEKEIKPVPLEPFHHVKTPNYDSNVVYHLLCSYEYTIPLTNGTFSRSEIIIPPVEMTYGIYNSLTTAQLHARHYMSDEQIEKKDQFAAGTVRCCSDNNSMMPCPSCGLKMEIRILKRDFCLNSFTTRRSLFPMNPFTEVVLEFIQHCVNPTFITMDSVNRMESELFPCVVYIESTYLDPDSTSIVRQYLEPSIIDAMNELTEAKVLVKRDHTPAIESIFKTFKPVPYWALEFY